MAKAIGRDLHPVTEAQLSQSKKQQVWWVAVPANNGMDLQLGYHQVSVEESWHSGGDDRAAGIQQQQKEAISRTGQECIGSYVLGDSQKHLRKIYQRLGCLSLGVF